MTEKDDDIRNWCTNHEELADALRAADRDDEAGTVTIPANLADEIATALDPAGPPRHAPQPHLRKGGPHGSTRRKL